MFKSITFGVLASGILLGGYFAILSFISGWGFAQSQFSVFWYFIVALSLGFGIQVGLYSYLKSAIALAGADSAGVVAVSGTTSTLAMVSCCAHYLANLLPILGVIGVVTFVAQYQVQLFWVGLLFNIGGIIYIGSRIAKFQKI
ncbi:MAG: hypothetical protein Q7J30_02090 [Candidatus Azambacteria bacterium]|nr:hypothetical protein [Candidatus Azambacteria bacterium]